MSTVILKWNPGFSSYTMVRFLNDLEKCAFSNSDKSDMNWSVWDYDKVHAGDTFYMLKVGYGQIGLVAKGTLSSDAYSGEDWSWRDRPTRYCDLKFEFMVNPDAYPLVDSAMLAQAIPDFDWKGGHSGLVLTDEQADKLESLWNEYMQRQAEYFDRASDQNLFMRLPDADESAAYKVTLDEDYGDKKIVVIEYREGDLLHKLTIYNYWRLLGKLGVKSWRTLRQLIYQSYPTREDLGTLCGSLFKHQIEFNADFYRIESDED